MLNEGSVCATIAVKDIAAGKAFYGGTLGLKQVTEEPDGVLYESGASKLFVYPSSFAGTNKATYATWSVDDLEGVVADLKGKGVTFMQYDDLPGVTRDGDIHTFGGTEKGAWFTDPDGNILALTTMKG